MAFETQVKEGGAWRTGLLVEGKDGGTWRDIQEIWAREGGSWRQVYVRSDPLSLNFFATWTKPFAEDSHALDYTFANPDDDLVQGDWDTVGHSHGTQRGMGAMRFAITGYGSRTVCTDIDLRLRVQSQYTSNGIHPRIAFHGSVLGASKPTTFSHVHGSYQATGTRTTDENDVTTDLDNNGGDDLLDGSRDSLIVHDFGDGTDSAAKELYRGTFHGTPGSSSEEPRLTMEADYL